MDLMNMERESAAAPTNGAENLTRTRRLAPQPAAGLSRNPAARRVRGGQLRVLRCDAV
jgi:hypothetical protein